MGSDVFVVESVVASSTHSRNHHNEEDNSVIKIAYLALKNSTFECFARAVVISVHFAALLFLPMT